MIKIKKEQRKEVTKRIKSLIGIGIDTLNFNESIPLNTMFYNKRYKNSNHWIFNRYQELLSKCEFTHYQGKHYSY